MPRNSSDGSAATSPPGPSSSSRPPARPYQLEGTKWLEQPGNRLLADEPGLGKSRQLVEASRGRTLVVAPAMVLDGGTWDEETELWADDPSRFQQVPYSQLNVREKGPRGGSVPTDKLKDEYRGHYDTAILDEAQYLKGRDSKWTKAAKKIDADQIYLATGTPIPNWADELFVPLQLIYPEEAKPGGRFGSYWRWAGQWFDTTPTRWSQGLPSVGELLGCIQAYGKPREGVPHPCFDRPPGDPCEHYLEFHLANLGDRFLQRLRDDVLTDLPPLTYQQVMTPMTSSQSKAYRDLKRDFISFAAGPGGADLVAWNSAALNEMLVKMSVGLEVVNPEAKRGSGKLDQLAFDLANRAHPTLVVAHHQEVLEAAKRVVTDPADIEAAIVHGGTSRASRAAAVAAFKAGQLPVLFGSLDTISEGLTLVQADMTIFLQRSYKPSRNTQAIRRIHRLGQTRPVTIREYFTPDSVDLNKQKLLELKTDRQVRHLTAAEFARLL